MASLVADYGTSSDEDKSEDESSESDANVKLEDEQETKSLQCEKLPAPSFGTNSTSIFTNPFIEEENAKQAILEKHVKMVNTRENVKTINGKKICWNYRKGRCRFGTKCTFAHDSDLQKTNEDIHDEQQNVQQQNVLVKNQIVAPENPILKTDNKVKKKRPGLTQGLVPGKKVMKMYKQSATSTRTSK
ncbi:uncharacterized protein LOC123296733 [Chrysoperla carnea]|uniref:uncharacterized protein LOC123296733 n=1 Tax=Chrysoperla carnea TaxID=189513 RepID=UPI001D0889DB|nr:uncharacterized protein LOC123296733 [Chrysoperla carnea]